MGKCKYCGQPARLFSHAHKERVEKYRNLKDSEITEASNGTFLSSDWLPKYRISLPEALKLVVENLGIQILLENQLSDYLPIIVDFSECKASKFVLCKLVEYNVLAEFCKRPNLNSLEHVRQKILIEYGFNNYVTDFVLSSIAYASGLEIKYGNQPKHINTDTSSKLGSSTVAHEILFMGEHIGEHIDVFKRLLLSKKFSRLLGSYSGLVMMNKSYGGDMSDYELIHWEEYEGIFADQDCQSLVLFASPMTLKVYRIDVKLRYSSDAKYIYNGYTFLYKLLRNKYGVPNKESPVDMSLSAHENCGKDVIYNDGKTRLTLSIEDPFPFKYPRVYHHTVLRYINENTIPLVESEKAQKAIQIDAENEAHRMELMSEI